MSIDNLESTVETVLLSFGIERAEIDGVLLIAIGVILFHIFTLIAYLKIKCSGISCKAIEKAASNSEKINDTVISLEKAVNEVKTIGGSQHDAIRDDLVKIDNLVIDLKGSVAQLHGIILGSSIPPGRKRIENDFSE